MERFGPGDFERPATNRGGTCRLLAYVSMLVVIMGSWAGCAAPEASPTPVPVGSAVPTATRAPTPIPTPTPTLVPPVTVELSGKVDDAGILLEDVEVISGDGLAILRLAKGTKVLDASGQPLDSMTVTASRPPAPSYERYLSGLAYDFRPGGARFEPLARLTISYDLPQVPAELVDEGMTQIAYFDEAESTWTWLDSTADLYIHRVTAEIDHLGTFIVMFEIWYVPPTS